MTENRLTLKVWPSSVLAWSRVRIYTRCVNSSVDSETCFLCVTSMGSWVTRTHVQTHTHNAYGHARARAHTHTHTHTHVTGSFNFATTTRCIKYTTTTRSLSDTTRSTKGNFRSFNQNNESSLMSDSQLVVEVDVNFVRFSGGSQSPEVCRYTRSNIRLWKSVTNSPALCFCPLKIFLPHAAHGVVRTRWYCNRLR